MRTGTNLTPRQEKWFASVRASLERDTGKPLEAWVQIVRTECREGDPRARRAWLMSTHGLLQLRANQILEAAFPPADPQWDEPDALRNALWTDPAAIAILTALEAAMAQIPDTITTQRKGFTAWSRAVQFAALRPVKGGKAMLGLAVAPESDSLLAPTKKEAWSERLKAQICLNGPEDITVNLVNLLNAAWQRS